MKREFKIAVRALVEYVMRSGDLELEFMGPARSQDGIRAHQRVQKLRPDHYASEVSVTHRIEDDQVVLEIGGRIDGVYFHENRCKSERVVIEEIKSTRRHPDSLSAEGYPVHQCQVKCYAYIYALQNNLHDIDTQLTYYHLDTREITIFKKSHTFEELEVAFMALVSRYLTWAGKIFKWAKIRDDSIEKMIFPFASYRPGQRLMAVGVYKAVRDKQQLLVQAATGIGKTMAAIFPTLKALGEGHNEKIFYLTARTTGTTAAEKAIDKLREKGLKFKHLTLMAKDKICFNPDSLCTAEECEFAKGYYDRLNEAVTSLFSHDDFSRERIEKTARDHQVCPFELSLDLSLWVDGVICDYNYAFDPRVFLRRFFAEGNGAYTFLIDESHNLVDRSRDMFSAEIYKQPFLDLRRSLKNHLPSVYKRLGKVNAWLVIARKACEAAGGSLSEVTLPDDLPNLLREFLWETERWLSLNLKTPFREALLELYFTVTGFVRVTDNYNQSYITCHEKSGRDLRVKLFCMDPSERLAEALKRCQTAVFFSATLTPMDYFHRIFGCETTAEKLLLSSPFPEKNLGVFIADRISTTYRERQNTKEAVSGALEAFVKAKKGNYLLFFPPMHI